MNKNVIIVSCSQDFMQKMHKKVTSGDLTGFYATQSADGMHIRVDIMLCI